VGVIVLLGVGILSATSRTKMRDPGAGGTRAGGSTTVVERRPGPPSSPNS
jgi:hypothetical protein